MIEQSEVTYGLQSSDDLIDALYLLDPTGEDARLVAAELRWALIREIALRGDDAGVSGGAALQRMWAGS
jgi:hypothetical protein